MKESSQIIVSVFIEWELVNNVMKWWCKQIYQLFTGHNTKEVYQITYKVQKNEHWFSRSLGLVRNE